MHGSERILDWGLVKIGISLSRIPSMPADSDFMLTAEERRLKQLGRRRIFIACVVLMVVLIVGFFGARPAMHAIKAWQSRRHAEKAFVYIENENWLEARK